MPFLHWGNNCLDICLGHHPSFYLEKRCRFGYFFCLFFSVFPGGDGQFQHGRLNLLEKICWKDEEWGWEEWTRSTLMCKLAGWNIYNFDNTLFPVLLIKPLHHQNQTDWVQSPIFWSFCRIFPSSSCNCSANSWVCGSSAPMAVFISMEKEDCQGLIQRDFLPFANLWKESPGPISNPQ